ncbi:endonuclease/exonuclease/phosphatase family protein [Acidaminobacter sp. JC074]|uniref:endonuclease/exonuclease/phosphatase family protein n=1 Tax=Acidaminobacter sp. JC074 TaxID=2530199 RepID=UPI001F105E1F|nr:endonuclease/exonuclease/phosphatase family protein [Acidaminobacter sp. JC074]MCH4889277.1 endonuclease/exonuclease/phosphatase family protein [Acidaminobacter sp. JC074]
MKTIFKILIILVGLIALYLLLMTLTDFKPDEIISLKTDQQTDKVIDNKQLKITTFNIGYATLDENADFFMEGGKQSKAESKEVVMSNLEKIVDFLKNEESDIYLLQEVDKKSLRTKNINQYDYIKESFSDYESTYAVNYKVPWVPVPVLKPYGYVDSGIVVLSKYQGIANRYQFPGEEAWPRQLALLDRCFTETRYPYKNKEVIVLNVHMSAYDSGGVIREQQVAYLKEHLEELKSENAYVIIGGDFNHELPGTNADDFNDIPKPDWLKTMDTSFEGYSWYVDNTQPTSRSMETPYVKGQNYECIIDGFMLSDNIELVTITHHDLEFKNSDHNPVSIEIKLN